MDRLSVFYVLGMFSPVVLGVLSISMGIVVSPESMDCSGQLSGLCIREYTETKVPNALFV